MITIVLAFEGELFSNTVLEYKETYFESCLILYLANCNICSKAWCAAREV